MGMDPKEYLKELEKLTEKRGRMFFWTGRPWKRRLLLREGRYKGQEWKLRAEELWSDEMRALKATYESTSCAA